MKINRMLRIVGAALLAMFLNVLAFVLWMAIYGYLINPGHPEAFYQARAQEMGPYGSIVTGIPIFFLISYLLTRKREVGFAFTAAFLFWLLYAIVDVSILLLSGWGNVTFTILVFVSMATKLCASLFGASLAKKKISN